MRPWGNSVLVRMDPEKSTTHSGILYKPDGAHEDVLRTGEVVDVGPGKYLRDDSSARTPMDVKVGDGVVFVKFVASFTETAKSIQKVIGKDMALLQLSDIMLVYDRKEAPEFTQ